MQGQLAATTRILSIPVTTGPFEVHVGPIGADRRAFALMGRSPVESLLHVSPIQGYAGCLTRLFWFPGTPVLTGDTGSASPNA